MKKKNILVKTTTFYYTGPKQVPNGYEILGCKFEAKVNKNCIGNFIVSSSPYEFDDEEKKSASESASNEISQIANTIINSLNLKIDDGYYKILSSQTGERIEESGTKKTIIASSFNIRCSSIEPPFIKSELPKKEIIDKLLEIEKSVKNNFDFELMMRFYNAGKELRMSYPRDSFLEFYKVLETYWVGYCKNKMSAISDIWNHAKYGLELDLYFDINSITCDIREIASLDQELYKRMQNKNEKLLILLAIRNARNKLYIGHGKKEDVKFENKFRLPFKEVQIIAREAIKKCISFTKT